MRLVVVFALTVMMAAMVRPASAQQGNGLCAALLIGNSDYMWGGDPALKEPVNDARSLGDELKRAGFDVDIKENLNRDEMQRAIKSFYAKLRRGMTGLVFFSGYGLQVNRQGYLIPVDMDIWNISDIQPKGISVDSILAEMNTRGAAVKIAIIDAGRRSPFERRIHKDGAQGLPPVSAPLGTLVLYSATAGTPGGLVKDSSAERSLFIGELVKEIRGQGVSAEEVFNRTRMGVSRASSNEQNPSISSSLSQEFSFSSCGRNAVPPANLPPIGTNDSTTIATNQEPSRPQAPAKPQPPACIVANVPPPKATTAPPADDLKSLDERVRRNQRDAAAFNVRGQFYVRYGQFPRAITDFDEAVRLKPDDPEARNNRCWARIMLGDTNRAMQDCNEALRLRPAYGDALDSRGLINLKLCRNSEALADYESALRYNPGQASSLYGRGIAKMRTGNESAGTDDIVSAKRIAPSIGEEFKGYGVTAGGGEVSAR
jgi:hypothetical protein